MGKLLVELVLAITTVIIRGFSGFKKAESVQGVPLSRFYTLMHPRASGSVMIHHYVRHRGYELKDQTVLFSFRPHIRLSEQ